ncbi:cytochrome P450, partial [Streptomyces sp. NPDC056728]
RWRHVVARYHAGSINLRYLAPPTAVCAIAAGIVVGAANRDPRQWGPDADAFRVTRAASGHLAFGMGIHQCVGQPISRLETEVLLTALVRRVEHLEPAGRQTPFVHNTLRGWSSVPVRAVAG